MRTTKGLPVAAASSKTALHQHLIEQDCVACHQEHRGTRLVQRGRKAFSHELLREAVREGRTSCHAKPADTIHRGLAIECGSCHQTGAWKPATFDHAKLFVLDRDHDVRRDTCHPGNDYARHNCHGCHGCHEHRPAEIRAKHLEEGIAKFESCVECHRDARAEPQQRGAEGHDPRGERD